VIPVRGCGVGVVGSCRTGLTAGRLSHQYLFVHRLQGDEGASIEFDNVLLAENGGKFTVGTPSISGAKVSATILSHLKGEKVIVFKKKRRKGYKKKNGHRQHFTKIQITGISL
jgi:large subunit ribosomal protein L21